MSLLCKPAQQDDALNICRQVQPVPRRGGGGACRLAVRADRPDDAALGIRSSALSLGDQAPTAVGLCYGATAVLLAIAAGLQEAGGLFWLLWAVATAGLLPSSLPPVLRRSQQLQLIGSPRGSRSGERQTSLAGRLQLP